MNLEEIQNRYQRLYSDIQYVSGTGRASNLYHRKIEKNLEKSTFDNVLEVGSGSGEHLQFVKHDFKRYIISDLILPNLNDMANAKKIEFEKNKKVVELKSVDVQKMKFDDSSFERVVSTCLLHHVQDPHSALLEMRRVAKNGAIVNIYIPSDPGIFYRFSQHLVSTRVMLKYFTSTEIKYLRASEHRNHVASLTGLIKGVFAADLIEIYSFPKISLGWNSRLFQIFTIRVLKHSQSKLDGDGTNG
jgi:phosphatidylethanolamine/phosphatidyl-N-methylethanolamine N-methyltransferase